MSKPIRRLDLAGADVKIFSQAEGAHEAAAEHFSSKIRFCVDFRGKAILGLSTGATPEPLYARLVKAHRDGMLSFAKVSTYNLDEYYPIEPTDPNSYRTYMQKHLFGRVDIIPSHTHLLDGSVSEPEAAQNALDFDRSIAREGGLDIQLLGLGRNGHIGFNEPSDLSVEQAKALPTRIVDLHPITIEDAAKDFGGEANVPRRALTMGVSTILSARSILVLAFGSHKAPAVARSLLGPISAGTPGSLLQAAGGGVTWMLDRAAAAEIL